MDNFFVQIIDDDGIPGRLYGPATWDQAIEKIKSYVAYKGPHGETLEEANQSIDVDGFYNWGNNGEEITIIQSEPIDSPFYEDEDEDFVLEDDED